MPKIEIEDFSKTEEELFSPNFDQAAIDLELSQVTRTDNTGGLHWPDTLNALKWRFRNDKRVEIIIGICEMESEQIPLFIEDVVKKQHDKQWFAFTYQSDPEHMIGIVIDRESREMRIYDHREHSRQSSLADSRLNGLAKSLGYQIIDGSKLSPYGAQQENWECGVLAVNAIEDNIASNQERSPLPLDKTIDLKTEAKKILIAASKQSKTSDKQKDIYLYFLRKWNHLFPEDAPADWVHNDLWSISRSIVNDPKPKINTDRILQKLNQEQNQILSGLESEWNRFYSDRAITPWVVNQFKKLQKTILTDPDAQNNLKKYFKGLMAESRLNPESRETTDLLGMLEQIDYNDKDYQDYSKIAEYLNDNYDNLKEILPGSDEKTKQKNLKQISYGRFFSFHHAAPTDFMLGKETSTELKDMEERNLALFLVPELVWLLRGLPKQKMILFARHLRIMLSKTIQSHQDIDTVIKDISNDLKQVASGNADMVQIEYVRTLLIRLVEIAKTTEEYTALSNILNYNKQLGFVNKVWRLFDSFVNYSTVTYTISRIADSENKTLLKIFFEADIGTNEINEESGFMFDGIRIAHNSMTQFYLNLLEDHFETAEDNSLVQEKIREQVLYVITQAIENGDIDFLTILANSSLIKDERIHGIFYAELMAMRYPNKKIRALLEANLSTAARAQGLVSDVIKFQQYNIDHVLAQFDAFSLDILSTDNITELLSTKDQKEILFQHFFSEAHRLNPQQLSRVLLSYNLMPSAYSPAYPSQIKQILSLENKPDLNQLTGFFSSVIYLRDEDILEILDNLNNGLNEVEQRQVLKMATAASIKMPRVGRANPLFTKYPRDPEVVSSVIAETINLPKRSDYLIDFNYIRSLVIDGLSLEEQSDPIFFHDFLEHLIKEIPSEDFVELMNCMHQGLKNKDLLVMLSDFIKRANGGIEPDFDDINTDFSKYYI